MMYYFHTRVLPAFNEFAKNSIIENIDMLNENSFSIWMMDDGYLRRIKEKNYTPNYSLSIKRFKIEEVEHLTKILKEKFDLNSKVTKNKNDKVYSQCFLYFPVSETQKISNIIQSCDFAEDLKRTMSYKIAYLSDEVPRMGGI